MKKIFGRTCGLNSSIFLNYDPIKKILVSNWLLSIRNSTMCCWKSHISFKILESKTYTLPVLVEECVLGLSNLVQDIHMRKSEKKRNIKPNKTHFSGYRRITSEKQTN